MPTQRLGEHRSGQQRQRERIHDGDHGYCHSIQANHLPSEGKAPPDARGLQTADRAESYHSSQSKIGHRVTRTADKMRRAPTFQPRMIEDCPEELAE